MEKNSEEKKNVLGLSKKKNRKRGMGNSPFPWLLPLSILLVLTFLYPIFEIIRLSFTNSNLVQKGYHYTLSSYIHVFTSSNFMNMLWITIVFVVASVTFQLILGFLIALLINEGIKRKLKGTIITRTAVLSAWAIPGVIIGIIWNLMYGETASGIINYLLSFVGVHHPIQFLSNPNNALISVTIANIWRGTAFSMIFIYAGLQTFPTSVLEASKIDGANVMQRLFRVIVPVLRPIILVNLIVITVQTFNTFDMVMALTGGGPGQSTEVISLNIYDQIFQNFQLGKGAATSVILLIINMAMTILYFRVLQRDSTGGRT